MKRCQLGAWGVSVGPYIAITVVAGILALLSQIVARALSGGETNRRWTYFDYLTVAALVTFSAMRFNVGSDFWVYSSITAATDPAQDWWSQMASSPLGPTFAGLILLVKWATDSPPAIFWVASALTVIPVYAAIKKESNNLPLAVLLYILLAFFVGPFNIIRQGIAIALNFWASTFLDTNKRAFVLINAVATLFHSTAVIAAIIQFLVRNWKPSAGRVFLYLSVSVAAAMAFAQIPQFTVWLASILPDYEQYIIGETTKTGVGTFLVIASRLALLFFALYLARDGSNARWINYVAIGLMFLVISTQSVVVARMEAYFGMFLILLLPNLLARRKNSAVLKVLLVAAAAVYFAFHLANYAQLVPYQTYLSNPN